MRYWPRTSDKSLPCKGFACRGRGHRVCGRCPDPGRRDRRRSADGRAGGVRSDARRRTGGLCSSADGIRDHGVGHPLGPRAKTAARGGRARTRTQRVAGARQSWRNHFVRAAGDLVSTVDRHTVDRSHGGPCRSRRRYRFQRNWTGNCPRRVHDHRLPRSSHRHQWRNQRCRDSSRVRRGLPGGLGKRILPGRKLELDAADCLGGNCRHVFRQHSGSHVGKLRQNGQRRCQLCEHSVRRRPGADVWRW